MANRFLIPRGIVLLVVVSGLSGCGGCGSKADRAQQDVARRGSATIDSCGGLSVSTVAEFLDVDLDSLVSEGDPEEDYCLFFSRKEPRKTLMFSVTAMDSDDEAQALLEAMAEALETISPIEPQPDVGDGGFLASSAKARRLLFRSGSSVFDLMQPTDPELQLRAAKHIVSGL